MSDSETLRVLVVSPDRKQAEQVAHGLERSTLALEVAGVDSSRRTLELFAQGNRPDVVVAQHDMMGVGRSILLAEIQDMYPEVARVALVSKPGDHNDAASVALGELAATDKAEDAAAHLARVRHLHTVLSAPRLVQLVSGVERLPASPEAYWELRKAAADPDTGMAQLAGIIQRDPVLSAKVLQLINSAFFGMRRRVTSVHQAVAYLGVNLIKALALASQVFSTFEADPVPGLSVDHMQSYSIRIARLAQRLTADPELGEEAFTAAIVHDIGQIVLAVQFGEMYAELARDIDESGDAMWLAERDVFGANHAEVGALLLRQWGIPFTIVETVAFHHEPRSVRWGRRDVLAACHAAEALTGIVTCGDPEIRLDTEFLLSAGFGAAIPGWRELASEPEAAA